MISTYDTIYRITKVRIEELLEWATDNPWFSTEFLEKIYNLIEKDKPLTSNQVRAVNNIYDKFIE